MISSQESCSGPLMMFGRLELGTYGVFEYWLALPVFTSRMYSEGRLYH
jgi:hypothetical protein